MHCDICLGVIGGGDRYRGVGYQRHKSSSVYSLRRAMRGNLQQIDYNTCRNSENHLNTAYIM